MLRRLAAQELLRCVRQLPPDQQECVVLRFLQGMSVAETATVMERNTGAVKALQHRALRRLAALLPEGIGCYCFLGGLFDNHGPAARPRSSAQPGTRTGPAQDEPGPAWIVRLPRALRARLLEQLCRARIPAAPVAAAGSHRPAEQDPGARGGALRQRRRRRLTSFISLVRDRCPADEARTAHAGGAPEAPLPGLPRGPRGPRPAPPPRRSPRSRRR